MADSIPARIGVAAMTSLVVDADALADDESMTSPE
jgi:hypothetical protein